MILEKDVFICLNICSTHLKFKKMSKICDFDRILKTECNLKRFSRICRTKNLDDLERDEADAYLWKARLLNVKEKGMTICVIMSRCLVIFLRGAKVNFEEY